MKTLCKSVFVIVYVENTSRRRCKTQVTSVASVEGNQVAMGWCGKEMDWDGLRQWYILSKMPLALFDMF